MWPFNPTEFDILAKNAKGKIIVIGPMGSYKSGDPTLPLLIKFMGVRGTNITVMDYKGANIKNHDKDRIDTYGDLNQTRESMESLHQQTIHYVLADALKLPFSRKCFDTVIDRLTNQWIFTNGASVENLLNQYNKILKKSGKMIFFCSEYGVSGTNFYYEPLLSELVRRGLFGLKMARLNTFLFSGLERIFLRLTIQQPTILSQKK